MLELTVQRALSEEATAALAGKFLNDRDYTFLLPQEPCRVYRDDGSLLLSYLPEVCDQDTCTRAWGALRGVAKTVTNRGTAAGFSPVRRLLKDGSRTKTTQTPLAPELKGVGTAIVGAYERAGHRFPACRLTAFNLDHPDKFAAAVPFFQQIDSVFHRAAPERWAAQMARVRDTHPAWVIHGTSFTTVTVNKNFRTAVHTDRGDLREGFGVMTALRAGEYAGCYFVFPAYRVAVDMRTRSVLLADVHEWHGNTELVGVPGRYERISCVLYYRAKMERCLSPEAELLVGKRRQVGDPIWPRGG